MPSPASPSLRLRIESSSLAVRQALSDIGKALQPLQLDADDRDTVELVLAEVLNNIVEHAHGDRVAPDQAIEIECEHLADGLHLLVTDNGTGLPGGEPPEGRIPPLDMEDLPEGGFGWFLIHRLAKDVRYSRRNGKNVLDFRLAVGARL